MMTRDAGEGPEDDMVSEEVLRQERLRFGAMILDIAFATLVLTFVLMTVMYLIKGEDPLAAITGALTVVFVVLAIPGVVRRRRERRPSR